MFLITGILVLGRMTSHHYYVSIIHSSFVGLMVLTLNHPACPDGSPIRGDTTAMMDSVSLLKRMVRHMGRFLQVSSFSLPLS